MKTSQREVHPVVRTLSYTDVPVAFAVVLEPVSE